MKREDIEKLAAEDRTVTVKAKDWLEHLDAIENANQVLSKVAADMKRGNKLSAAIMIIAALLFLTGLPVTCGLARGLSERSYHWVAP